MKRGLAILAGAAVAVGCTVTTIMPYGSDALPGTASVVVGAAGGLVAANDGTTLLIPPNALSGDITVTIALDDSTPPPAQARPLAPAHVFGPPDVTFAVPVCVTLSYERAMLPADGSPQAVVVYETLDDAGTYLALPTVAAGPTLVQGMTTSLSTMVVGYGGVLQVDAAPGDASWDPGILDAGATAQ